MPYIGAQPDKGNFADLNGAKLILDADADTSITSDTDDQIDIEIAGSDELKITAAMIAPATADGSALGGASNEWSDLYLADSSVIYFGADQEVTLTHNHDTSLTCNLMVAATTFEPTGDTAAGDNAALGYTSVLGAILTGQGSTNDVTLVNDADATVLGIPTGTTNVDIVGVATAATFEPDGDTAAGDNSALGYTSVLGAILTGQGSTNDVTLVNDADATVLSIPTGTTNVSVVGQLISSDGSEAAPGISFSRDSGAGLFSAQSATSS